MQNTSTLRRVRGGAESPINTPPISPFSCSTPGLARARGGRQLRTRAGH